LDSSESLAIGAFGRLKAYPEAFFLRRFITSWQFPHFSADSARSPVEAESHDRLSESGENLVNVIRGLREAKSPELTAIVSKLSRWAPRFQKLMIRKRNDGQLVLRLKDEQFADPILSKFISDGTLQLLYYLVLFAAPKSSPLIGVEEPENHLHPRLLRELAEEFRKASARMQLFVTTHSPYFASGMRPDEVWVVHRDAGGYSRARRTCDMQGIPEFLDEGALLGDLWMENHFAVGDPLAAASASGRRSGSPPRRRGKR
jgi:predicted ATPase